MAVITQTENIQGRILPLVEPAPTAALVATAVPQTQFVHCTPVGGQTVNAPGSGNTGVFQARLRLPRNYAWSLQKAYAHMSGLNGNNWADAYMLMYLPPSPDVPMDDVSVTSLYMAWGTRDLSDPSRIIRHFWPTGVGDDSPGDRSAMSWPDWLIYSDGQLAYQPTFIIANDTAGDVTARTIHWKFIWNGYPIEQSLNAAVHGAVPLVSR